MDACELIAIRERCGMNKNQLADYCNISRTTIWRMELDDQKISRSVELAVLTLEPASPAFREWLKRQTRNQRRRIIKRIYMSDLYIYALKDPRNGIVKYVGRTSNIKTRYRKHLSSKKSLQKDIWIGELKACGLEPEVIILEKVDRRHVIKSEMKWIKHYRKDHELFNGEKRRV